MSEAYCYVCIKDGAPGAYAASVDVPEHKKETAKFVSKALRAGDRVERVPVEQARTMLGQYLDWRSAQKKTLTLINTAT